MAYMVTEYGVPGTGSQTISISKGARPIEAIIRSGQIKLRAIVDPAVIETEPISLNVLEQGVSSAAFLANWFGAVTVGAKNYDVFRV